MEWPGIDVTRRFCRLVNEQDRPTFDALHRWADLQHDYRLRAAVAALSARLFYIRFRPRRLVVRVGPTTRRCDALVNRIAKGPFADLTDLALARRLLVSAGRRQPFDAQNTTLTATTLIILGASSLGNYHDRETWTGEFERTTRRSRVRLGTAPWFVTSGWLASDQSDARPAMPPTTRPDDASVRPYLAFRHSLPFTFIKRPTD